MRIVPALLVCLLIAFPFASPAQIGFQGHAINDVCTVSQMLANDGTCAAPIDGTIVVVTDATSDTDCGTGGGASRNWCHYDGSSWSEFSPGGAGGGAVNVQRLQDANHDCYVLGASGATGAQTYCVEFDGTDLGAVGGYMIAAGDSLASLDPITCVLDASAIDTLDGGEAAPNAEHGDELTAWSDACRAAFGGDSTGTGDYRLPTAALNIDVSNPWVWGADSLRNLGSISGGWFTVNQQCPATKPAITGRTLSADASVGDTDVEVSSTGNVVPGDYLLIGSERYIVETYDGTTVTLVRPIRVAASSGASIEFESAAILIFRSSPASVTASLKVGGSDNACLYQSDEHASGTRTYPIHFVRTIKSRTTFENFEVSSSGAHPWDVGIGCLPRTPSDHQCTIGNDTSVKFGDVEAAKEWVEDFGKDFGGAAYLLAQNDARVLPEAAGTLGRLGRGLTITGRKVIVHGPAAFERVYQLAEFPKGCIGSEIRTTSIEAAESTATASPMPAYIQIATPDSGSRVTHSCRFDLGTVFLSGGTRQDLIELRTLGDPAGVDAIRRDVHIRLDGFVTTIGDLISGEGEIESGDEVAISGNLVYDDCTDCTLPAGVVGDGLRLRDYSSRDSATYLDGELVLDSPGIVTPKAKTIAAIADAIDDCPGSGPCEVRLACDATYTDTTNPVGTDRITIDTDKTKIVGCGTSTILDWTFTSSSGGSAASLISVEADYFELRDVVVFVRDNCTSGCLGGTLPIIDIPGSSPAPGTVEPSFERVWFDVNSGSSGLAFTTIHVGRMEASPTPDGIVWGFRLVESVWNAGSGTWVYAEWCDQCNVEGNIFQRAASASGSFGVRKEIGDGFRIVNNDMTCQRTGAGAAGCVWLGPTTTPPDGELPQSAQVIGNTFHMQDDTTHYGVYLPAYQGATIADNVFVCDGNTVGSECSGVWLNDLASQETRNNTALGNVFVHFQDDGAATSPGCAIKVTDGAESNVIAGNLFDLVDDAGARDTTSDGLCTEGGPLDPNAYAENFWRDNMVVGDYAERFSKFHTVHLPTGAWLEDLNPDLANNPPTKSFYGGTISTEVWNFDDHASEEPAINATVIVPPDLTDLADVDVIVNWRRVGSGEACGCLRLNSGLAVTGVAEDTQCAAVGDAAAVETETYTFAASIFDAGDNVNLQLWRDVDASESDCSTDDGTADIQPMAVRVRFPVR